MKRIEGRSRFNPSLRLRVPDLFGDFDNLGYAEEAGWVVAKDHPELPLTLYVYTNDCLFESGWNDATKQCRGLIVGPNGRIVALPFPKTFLVDVHMGGASYVDPLPKGPFRVTTKVDGSLAIIYWFADQWRLASKGSFQSEHAVWGAEYLAGKDLGGLDRSLTYLAEMIIPDWGRIVVDNGNQADMVLLGARSLYTGEYQRMETLEAGWAGIGSVVQSWGSHEDPAALTELVKANHRPDGTEATGLEFEGVVLQWEDGTIAKAKLQDYINLHSTFTETTELSIWRLLASGAGVASIMERAPDELVEWIRTVDDGLVVKHAELMNEVRAEFNQVSTYAHRLAEPGFPERKDFTRALRELDTVHGTTVFLVMNDPADEAGKLSNWAWDEVRPVGRTTFRKVEEEADA